MDSARGLQPGQRDASLTPIGGTQVGAAVGLLREAGATHLFSSDRQSALMSARLIGELLGLEVRPDPALRERRLVSAQDPGGATPGGEASESTAELYARVEGFFDAHRDLPPGAVVVVSHAGWIQVAASYLAGAGPDEVEWQDVPQGGVRVARWRRSAHRPEPVAGP